MAEQVALDSMMIFGAHPEATADVRAVVLQRVAVLGASLAARHDDDAVTEAHLRQAERDIARYLEDPAGVAPESAAPAWGRRPRSRYPLPPGPPLGNFL